MRPPTAALSIGSSVGLAIGLLLSLAAALPVEPAHAREADRTLKLYFGHTGERGTFTFKRNGRYDRKELERINKLLRDWRKEESTRMDPQLLDLVWEIYEESGARDYIHVISAYRSPKTNGMLRKRSSGVAKNSQHVRGKAIDFAIPDVPLDKLRAVAMKKQGGGVGYYPRSGSPFVHVDTGSVRAWPRMSRQQLVALFPNGETLHLPSDGKPLPGYEQAVARRQSSGSTTLAYLETEEPADGTDTGKNGGVKAWLSRVFPGGGEAENEETASPSDTDGKLIAATDEGLESRMPRPRPQAEIELAAAESLPPPTAVTSVDARMIATLAFAPLPRTRPDPAFLAASLGDRPIAAEPLPVRSDVIARLLHSGEPAPAAVETATADPVELAFAALEESPELPSDEDRVAIAAFAAMRAQAAAPAANAKLAVEEEPRLLLAAVVTPAAAQPAADTDSGGPAGGVVLAPDGVPSYTTDQNALHGLIATPATYDPQFARLAMPAPADSPSIYRAPDAADELSYLASQPGPPVDRFAAAETSPAPAERGFFMRLFASLIE